jgi:uncharacterized protein (DUF3820 family)
VRHHHHLFLNKSLLGNLSHLEDFTYLLFAPQVLKETIISPWPKKTYYLKKNIISLPLSQTHDNTQMPFAKFKLQTHVSTQMPLAKFKLQTHDNTQMPFAKFKLQTHDSTQMPFAKFKLQNP